MVKIDISFKFMETPTEGTGRPLSVLVVDDEQSILLLFSLILECTHNHVRTASNIPEALHILIDEHQEIGILITDLNISVAEKGTSLIRAVKKLYPHIKTVLMSGGTDKLDQIAFECGATTHLSKPFSINQAIQLINTISNSQ
jgi:DNA-binding NtrC family response regulator